ncbi:MAG: hypothetical protein REI12_14920 [Pedobacter sp.]|nr:hypothetical protein [Pedobacter sp.]
MSELTTLDLVKWILALLLIVLPVLLLQYRIDISRIRKSAQEKGWDKARITPIAGERKSLNEGNKRFYRVDYINAEGKECFATCQASILGGIAWKE